MLCRFTFPERVVSVAGFDALYRQTITLFNHKTVDDATVWFPMVISNVHLIIDKSIIISSYGEQSQDNAQVHIMYTLKNGGAYVNGKRYMMPKEWQKDGNSDENFTLNYGDEYDFFMEGDYGTTEPIHDDDYRNGFYNYMNKNYDNVFAITTVSKFNIIPHFEIGAR